VARARALKKSATGRRRRKNVGVPEDEAEAHRLAGKPGKVAATFHATARSMSSPVMGAQSLKLKPGMMASLASRISTQTEPATPVATLRWSWLP